MTHSVAQTDTIFSPSARSRAVPRYTSYPTAPHFAPVTGPEQYARALAGLPEATELSLYAHIPFCDRLCWFCACRTQGTSRRAPVTEYLEHLDDEIARVGRLVPRASRVTHMHWGGGSPTILSSLEMKALKAAFDAAFPMAQDSEIAVEIDPRDITADRLDGLAAIGITRASIGVQDFDADVQRAIGREQPEAMTREVVDGLRGIGITGLNIDLLYGLPGQTMASLGQTIDKVLRLSPDRIALFGYAHVPWMSRRQTMIDESTLPGVEARVIQAADARKRLTAAGYIAIGIDHFAKPGDRLAQAAEAGTLRRNFQGYTTDCAEALLAFGASAIGELPQGYFQNEPATTGYKSVIAQGGLATARGHLFTLEDRVRKAAINSLLCSFSVDLAGLEARFGDFAQPVRERLLRVAEVSPAGAVELDGAVFRIRPPWHDRVRLVAAELDTYFAGGRGRHSLAV